MHLKKIRSLTLIGLAGTLAFGTAGLTTAASKKTPTRQATARHTTVLPLSEGRVLGQGSPGSFWTPQAADLRRLEHDLPPSIADYYRQYIGITEGGRRLIYINGFSASVAPEFTGGPYDWHRHAVWVMDGGNGFFHATYDPHTRRFTGPEYNGMG